MECVKDTTRELVHSEREEFARRCTRAKPDVRMAAMRREEPVQCAEATVKSARMGSGKVEVRRFCQVVCESNEGAASGGRHSASRRARRAVF